MPVFSRLMFIAVAASPCSLALWAQEPAEAEQVVKLDALTITGEETSEIEFDQTGMGGAETAKYDEPFSNDLIRGRTAQEGELELGQELQAVASPSAADLATGSARLNLRGFPTPELRNGFGQTGIPEILNIDRSETIQGVLIPVTGRAAPGGIRSAFTLRPKGSAKTRLRALATTQDEWEIAADDSGVLLPKRLWYRVNLAQLERQGPQRFAWNRVRLANGVVTWRHNKILSTMYSLELLEYKGNPAPAVAEYRVAAPQTDPVTGEELNKIVGPYQPLAEFHVYGPNARLARRVRSASVQAEAQVSPSLQVRAGVQAFSRDLLEERFTTGQYLLSTGKFGGVREPQHTEQPLDALATGLEMTKRSRFFGADHKSVIAVDDVHTRYRREQRGILPAERALYLPPTARQFDPAAPDYFRPDFDPLVYQRIVTDRLERAGYTTLTGSQRTAWSRGKLVSALGVRVDWVSIEVEDRKEAAPLPYVQDHTRELTYYAGLNHQLIPGKLLTFLNASTAFEPSTRVDARTGRVQGNETTSGGELGAKFLAGKGRISGTVTFFRYINKNISRRNPLYDDPILDADKTQPQLVAAGAEQFTGGSLDLRSEWASGWGVSGRYTLTDAITTASPDLPEEVGRALTRLPRDTLTFTGRFEKKEGLFGAVTFTYVGGYVQYYEDANRLHVAYGGYPLVGLTGGYSWLRGKTVRHRIALGVRNLLDRDLLRDRARAGAERSGNVSYSLSF